MRKLSLFIFSFVLFFACNSVNRYDKTDFIGTKKIEDNLYLETYCTYRGGVYGGDTHTCYLTDSISFRKYLGYYFDHEQVEAFPMNDTIIFVRKYDRNTNVSIEKTEYNLFTLKKEGKFD